MSQEREVIYPDVYDMCQGCPFAGRAASAAAALVPGATEMRIECVVTDEPHLDMRYRRRVTVEPKIPNENILRMSWNRPIFHWINGIVPACPFEVPEADPEVSTEGMRLMHHYESTMGYRHNEPVKD